MLVRYFETHNGWAWPGRLLSKEYREHAYCPGENGFAGRARPLISPVATSTLGAGFRSSAILEKGLFQPAGRGGSCSFFEILSLVL
jgi:hypothetical protein